MIPEGETEDGLPAEIDLWIEGPEEVEAGDAAEFVAVPDHRSAEWLYGASAGSWEYRWTVNGEAFGGTDEAVSFTIPADTERDEYLVQANLVRRKAGTEGDGIVQLTQAAKRVRVLKPEKPTPTTPTPATPTPTPTPRATDCWRAKAPSILSEYNQRYAGQQKGHTFTYSETSATLTVTAPDGKSYSNTMTWHKPPERICKVTEGQEGKKGQNVTLKVTSTTNPGALMSGGWWFNGYWQWVNNKPFPQASSFGNTPPSDTTTLFIIEPKVFVADAGSWVGTGHIPFAGVKVIWEYEKEE